MFGKIKLSAINSTFQFGPRRMERELRVLRCANENLVHRCVDKEVESHKLPETQNLWGKNLIGYQLKDDNDTTCHYLTLKERSFVDELRERQTKKSQKKLSHSVKNSKMSNNNKSTQLYDSKLFKSYMKENGVPDIEEMKKIFPFKGPPDKFL